MKKWFAAGLALVSLSTAAPLKADPVWVPVAAPQGVDGRIIATKLRLVNAGRAEKPYSANSAGLIQVETSEVDAWIETARGGRTFLTRVPVISEQNRVEAGAVAFLNGLDRNVAKLGLVNLGEQSAVCLVDLLRSDGSATGAIRDNDVGLGELEVPASLAAPKLLCARRRGCTGLVVNWRVYARGTLRYELAAVVPSGAGNKYAGRTKLVPIMRRSSTISKPRAGRTVPRPAPGKRARRLLARLRREHATSLRLKVVFANRTGDEVTQYRRIPLRLR